MIADYLGLQWGGAARRRNEDDIHREGERETDIER